MRCETARERLPDPRALRHARSCAACGQWLVRVDRGRALVGASFAPLPAGLASQVLSRMETLPTEGDRPTGSRPSRSRRLRLPVRAVALAASVVVLTAAAVVWMARSSERPAEALTTAATATKQAGSARFTFQGDFSVRLRVPPGALQSLQDLADDGIRSLGRAIAPPGIPEWIRKGIHRQVELRRDWLAGLMDGLQGEVASFAPEVRLEMSGDGEFTARDRVRLSADVAVREPADAGGAFELVRVGDEVFVRVEDAGWRAVSTHLPTRVLRPVALGLGKLADWIKEDARRARRVGTETVDGTETERYRLDLPARGEGVRNLVEVWIGVQDELVHRVLVTHDVSRSFAVLSGRVDIRMFDHGADLRIEIPDGAEPAAAPGFPPGLGIRLGEIDVWLGAGLPGPSA
jgi:hypothetical protein